MARHSMTGMWRRLPQRFAVLMSAVLLTALPSAAQAESEAIQPPASSNANATPSAEGERLFGAVVKVRVRAVPGARTNASLGAEREGTGIVIGPDGLILTIGYLIVEADEVNVVDNHGRTLPAKVVGYDHPTGLGLLRTVVPANIAPVALGESGKLQDREPVMIINHGGRDDVGLAFVVSRRPFTGNWEYALDQAIFTSPPTLNWSGAALIGRDGRLLGVGSLIVRDAVTGESTLPGNMFVPIDVLKPVLQDLIKNGRRTGPARPWLGVNADEIQGRLFVGRVSPEGPADLAGIAAGDIILGVGQDGVHSQSEFYAKVWNYGAAGTDIPLRILHDVNVREVKVHSIDRIDYFRPRSTY